MTIATKFAGAEDLVGNTPLVRANRFFPPPGPVVALKMEQFNPGGSIKDRTALGMLRAEEAAGRLRPGMTIIESSSGNTAIGLSMLAGERGYRVVAVCDRHLPASKRARLRALGAQVAFLPPTPIGVDTVRLRIALASSLADIAADAITLGQYSHPGNPDMHEATTGPEIWSGCQGRVSAVVSAVGTCGTITGVGRYLKQTAPNVRIIGVEPRGSVIFGGPPGRYLVQGGGLDFTPPNFDATVVDDGLAISDDAAFAALEQFASTEGWMLGGTAGLVLAGLQHVRPQFGTGDTLVGIVPDGGERYVDTVYDADWRGANRLAPGRPEDPLGEQLQSALREMRCGINTFGQDDPRALHALCARLGVDPSDYMAVPR